MKTAANKSSYDKLFLVQPEIYHKIVPKLNEIEKQELNDLNEKNRHFEEDDETLKEKNGEQINDNAEGLNDSAEEINDYAEEVIDDDEKVNDNVEEIDDNVIMDPPPENREEPEISVKMVKKSNGKWSIKKTPLKKVKNFSCKLCVNKTYTTKRSLQRHNNSFHVKKHSIKESQVIPEVIYPETTIPETVKSEERKSKKKLKRKHQFHEGEFHHERDSQQFSRDEPLIKRPKRAYSKVPKREKVKRKLNDDTNDFEGKKFRWESYSQ